MPLRSLLTIASSEEAIIALNLPSSSLFWVMSRAIFGAPTTLPSRIVNRRNGHRHGDCRSVLSHAYRFEVIDSFPFLEPGEDLQFPLRGGRAGNRHGNGLSDDLLRLVAEDTFGRLGSSFDIDPFRSLLMIASSEDSTIAASNARAS